MNFRIQTGKGITGCLRYVQGQGRDPKTGKLLELGPDEESRATLIGGTNFGFEVTTPELAELARKMMEHLAQNQASKTRKCVQDCVHIDLSWAPGETPTREEAMDAVRSALRAEGMGNAMALAYSHSDEDFFHVHVVASKINPATRRAYDLAASQRKGQDWAVEYEREHGGVINTRRESASELRRAIRERDIEGVLEAMTKRKAHFSAEELKRAVGKEIHPEIGAADGKKRSVELERAQFMNAILSHQSIRRLAEKRELPEPWMSAKGGLAGLSDEYRQSAERSYESWCARKPGLGEKYGLADYVQYVQDKWAKQDHKREALGIRYTTKSVLAAENHVLRSANGLKSATGHGVSEDQREAVLARKYGTMSGEQVHAFRHATADEGLAIIDGMAGTGKSFTMAAIRDVYEAARHRVIGLAPTNKVKENLAHDGFTHAKTVHAELFALNNGRTSWDQKTVVMVDEAAMLDTKLMAMVTAQAHDARAKLILVGDDRQLSSIDRGGMFAVLKERHGAAALSEVRRQHKIDHRRASEMMAEGNWDSALGIYEQAGAINWALTQKEARTSLVEKWAADTAAERDKARLVLGYTNDIVNELNIALRAVLKGRGELEWQDHSIKTAHGRFDFSAGDQIRFTANDRKLGIDNNATGTIKAIDGTHIAVRLDGPKGRTINFDAATFENFRHSYAGTIYAAQGSNLDSVYLLHSEHWRSSPAYVALTRHKEKTELFVARNTAKDLKELAHQVARTDDRRAASAFYQLDEIEPVRPMTAPEVLAEFAGEQFQRTAERMEREGKLWPARNLHPVSSPPWEAETPQPAPVYRQDNEPPAEADSSSIDPLPQQSQQARLTAQHDDEILDDEQIERRKREASVRAAAESTTHRHEELQPPPNLDQQPAADHKRPLTWTGDEGEEAGVADKQQSRWTEDQPEEPREQQQRSRSGGGVRSRHG
jgi:hypothetical protein